ncbi:hypothetical protein [Oceanobacillus sp. FSL H7-0719]|uniref:hypothetical protein n=1 Tax=Oceanobacillus sp. FSL H7-0719 TaxID=2954507 RepID=UPI003247E828
MEILYEGAEVADYIFGIVVLGIVTLLLLAIVIGFISDIMKYDMDRVKNIKNLIGVSIVALVLGIFLCFFISQGAEEYKKVLITDYNVIYEQGYEIVDQEGKIFKIVKEDE